MWKVKSRATFRVLTLFHVGGEEYSYVSGPDPLSCLFVIIMGGEEYSNVLGPDLIMLEITRTAMFLQS